MFLDEYTPAGTPVQSIPVTTTGGSAMTANGTSSTEGIISRSQDGTKLVFGGYRADAGTTIASANNRVVGTLDVAGSVNTSVAVTDLVAAVPRSATTVDGTAYWLGTSTSVRYVGTPSGASTSVSIDARNSRQVNLANSVLYASNGSTSITGKVQQYGTLPTIATAATPVVTLALSDAVNGFALFDLDAGVAGADTLYALNTVLSQLLKYTFNGTSWSASGSIGSVTAANIAGINTGGTVTLYLTTTTKLQTLTDSSGYNAAITGTISELATAGTNTGFRGLGLFPSEIPEPGTATLVFAALALAGCGLRRSRGR